MTKPKWRRIRGFQGEYYAATRSLNGETANLWMNLETAVNSQEFHLVAMTNVSQISRDPNDPSKRRFMITGEIDGSTVTIDVSLKYKNGHLVASDEA